MRLKIVEIINGARKYLNKISGLPFFQGTMGAIDINNISNKIFGKLTKL